jgi:GNAT superfamily N-acetyltransferase
MQKNIIKFEPTGLAILKKIREDYFRVIGLPQELLIEWIIVKGTCFKILSGRRFIGYFILSKNNYLVEFHLLGKYAVEREVIFKQVLDEFSVSKAFCKSFDPLLITCCHTFCKRSRIYGTLFRDYTNSVTGTWDNGISVRLAAAINIHFLLQFESGLYESPEELKYMVNNKMIYLFWKGEYLIGCGFLIKILPDKNFYDIGMWTNPVFRNQGYATKIIAWLKKHCLENNLIPVCGCSVDNIASRRTLEKNGFTSRHCLIEFIFS